jgi:hypothetical protein
MIVVLVMGVGLGWVVRSARIQRDAVAAILASGGSVSYDWEWSPGKGPITKGEPWAPRWLVDRLGVDHFGSVVMVTLGPQATDAVMAHVGTLRKLDCLIAANATGITDAGVAHLRSLVRLDHLDLNKTSATGACLADLAGLTRLHSLHLHGLPVDDDDLANLARMTDLEVLGLGSTRIGDPGLAHLRPLTKMKVLRLMFTRVVGPGLANLAGMTQLESLPLSGSPLATLESIPSVPS